MNKDLIKTFSTAIEYAKKELGYSLINEDWGNEKEKCTCALGCIILYNKKNLSSNNEATIEEILSVSQQWISAFLSGFDETPWNLKVSLTEEEYATVTEDIKNNLTIAYNSGVELRNKYKPIPYYRFEPGLSC